LNNLVAWVMSFWVEIVVSNNARFARINKVKEEKPKENGDIDVVDYEIERIKENLTTRLEELEDLKQRGMITEEEYQKLREEAINSYIK
ncbi:MAG: SHOCT domain-containing protein, partial [Clostridia bacterium]|nr:SHOCT domain-containing protein [Clostridia bacterium]